MFKLFMTATVALFLTNTSAISLNTVEEDQAIEEMTRMHHHPRGAHHHRNHKMMRAINRNAWRTANRIINKFDRDHNGAISREEFKKTMIHIMSNAKGGISKRVLEESMHKFDEADQNKDKNVTKKELVRCLRREAMKQFRSHHKRQLINRQAQQILDKFDKNHDGVVTKKEFAIMYWKFLKKQARGKKVNFRNYRKGFKIYDRIDKNHDNKVTRSELVKYIYSKMKPKKVEQKPTTQVDPRMSHYADKILAKFDINKDGRVTIREFRRALYRIMRAMGKRVTKKEFSKAMEYFHKADKNGNKVVTKAELMLYLQELIHRTRTPPPKKMDAGIVAEMDKILAKFDANKDGRISKHEFINVFIQMYKAKFKKLPGKHQIMEQLKMFDKADTLRDGVVTKIELYNCLKAMAHPKGPPFSAPVMKVVEEQLKKYDTNKDGKIDKAEFMKSMMEAAKLTADERAKDATAAYMKQAESQASAMFDKVDKNQDKTVTVLELGAFIKQHFAMKEKKK